MTTDPIGPAPTDSRKRVTSYRRSVLATFGIGTVAALSGCLGGDGGPSTGNDAATTATTTSSEAGASSAGTTTGTSSPSGSSGSLDLREANVVGVEIERNGDSYTFDVTLHHDDVGESGYANWWQVETLDGEKLGRRELLHAHGSDPFTRSDTIEIPEDVSTVVVRGHDDVHGYGGQTMVVTPRSGETRAVRQGPEPRSFGNESASSRRARR